MWISRKKYNNLKNQLNYYRNKKWITQIHKIMVIEDKNKVCIVDKGFLLIDKERYYELLGLESEKVKELELEVKVLKKKLGID